jgi:hypothetical protein
MLLLTAIPVVLPDRFDVRRPMSGDIGLVTNLAFVHSPISHSWVLVEILERLDGPTFETLF